MKKELNISNLQTISGGFSVEVEAMINKIFNDVERVCGRHEVKELKEKLEKFCAANPKAQESEVIKYLKKQAETVSISIIGQ